MPLDALPSDRKAPATTATAVTPHDTNPLPKVGSLYVGTGGNIALRTINSDADVLYKNIPNGGYLFLDVQYVRSTLTTATDIIVER